VPPFSTFPLPPWTVLSIGPANIPLRTLAKLRAITDLFGGFVPDSSVLESADAAYIIENAQPFHQPYMPSRELLNAGLARIRSRWPRIERIDPSTTTSLPPPSSMQCSAPWVPWTAASIAWRTPTWTSKGFSASPKHGGS
jgi:hypothetical protein